MSLLKRLPPNTGLSGVIVQHLDPEHQSNMVELLGKVTPMEVVAIEHGQGLQPNCVHVLPANCNVSIKHGVLKLRGRQRQGSPHRPIDSFFSSLARDQGANAIGVVLSGAGSDGTRGLCEIKQNGGMTFAESASTARFPAMPQSAIDSGCVDEVLPPAALAKRLVHIARHPFWSGPQDEADQAAALDPELEEVFQLLKSSTGVSFANYKHSTMRRRINRRMVLARMEQLSEYAELLRNDAKERELLFNDVLINVTSFFRDKEVFSELKKQILPRLIRSKPPGSDLRVWVPGCATGEEVYSIGICVVEVMTRLKAGLKVQIFGTDLSDSVVAKARSGVYPASIEEDLSPERLRRFFVRKDGGYQVSRALRELCTFARQNLCQDPPFSRLDLISCRNVLIYLGRSLQRKAIPLFFYALNPNGYLVLGSSETIGGFADLFALLDKKHKFYVKKATPLPPSLQLSETARFPRVLPVRGKKSQLALRQETSADIQKAADQLILTHFSPCGVVIDARLQVWHFRGQTAHFLEHLPGAASLNILKMVRHGLAPDLSAAIYQANKEGMAVRREGVAYQEGATTREVRIEVIPFTPPGSVEPWMLVIFEPLGMAPAPLPKKGRKGRDPSVRLREIERLRRELASTRESLESIIEEQEATNEELKSANEEIESSNEELQSANEELETAKAELQSTNEELTTVNDELNSRNVEISEINNDLNNLLSSIQTAILMVDSTLTIRRITPLAEKLFNIIPTDIGRRLSDINTNLDFPQLNALIREVIEQLTPLEREVRDREGHWYSLRVRPYRTRENVINGAVVMLVDINDLKREQQGRGGPPRETT